MPIEIRIIDPKNITIREIHELHEYLLTSSQIQEDIDLIPKNPRKKRNTTPKETIPSIDLPIETLLDPINEKRYHDVETTEEEVTLTSEEVIAFVLESTRTKKLKFDQVMEVVNQFQIPNLNSLDQFPHMITHVYLALKEIVNE